MPSWVRKSAVIRKGMGLTRKVPRAVRRVRSGPADFQAAPPVIANSFPKSGTHLLVQILEAFGPVRDYGTFWASTPSITFRERSEAQTLAMLDRVVPDELVRAHLYHAPAYQQALARHHAVHFFIYRDLRDVAVSEAHYLTCMNRWHRLHRVYKALPGTHERVLFSITGAGGRMPDSGGCGGSKEPGLRGLSPSHPDTARAVSNQCTEQPPEPRQPTAVAVPYAYPDIARRFSRYRGWLHEPDVFAVKFEDLVSERREQTIQAMATFYCRRHPHAGDPDDLTRRAINNIDPARSHTFRQGKQGGWRDALGPEHKAAFKAVAGDLLIELGYETDLSW